MSDFEKGTDVCIGQVRVGAYLTDHDHPDRFMVNMEDIHKECLFPWHPALPAIAKLLIENPDVATNLHKVLTGYLDGRWEFIQAYRQRRIDAKDGKFTDKDLDAWDDKAMQQWARVTRATVDDLEKVEALRVALKSSGN